MVVPRSTVVAENVTISVIIPSLGRQTALHNLVLLLLKSQTVACDEIIVVDQTPDEDSVKDVLQGLQRLAANGHIQLIRRACRGANEARNIAAERARGSILLFLDDDVFLPPTFISAHKSAQLSSPSGVVTGGVRNAGLESPIPLIKEIRRDPLAFLEIHNGFNCEVEDFIRVSGGNFSIRKAIYDEIGGFDEQFVKGCDREDIDLYFRLKKAGYTVGFDPKPWIYHLALPVGGGRKWSVEEHFGPIYNNMYFAFRNLSGKDFLIFFAKKIIRPYVFNRHALLWPPRLIKNVYLVVAETCRAKRRANDTDKDCDH